MSERDPLQEALSKIADIAGAAVRHADGNGSDHSPSTDSEPLHAESTPETSAGQGRENRDRYSIR